MKSSLLGLFLFLLFSTNVVGQNRVVIYGKVTNPTVRTLQMKYAPNGINEDEITIETDLDLNGEYALALEIDVPKPVTLVYNKKEMPLFISPDNRLQMNFDGIKFYPSFYFNGIGNNDNTFLQKFTLKFGIRDRFNEAIIPPSLYVADSIFDKMNRFNPTDFYTYVEKCQKAERDFYENHPLKEDLSQSMKNFIEARINYKWTSYLFAYAELLQKRKEIVPDEFFIFLWDIQISNDDAIVQPDYGAFLDLYLRYAVYTMYQDSIQTPFERFVRTFEIAQLQLKDYAEEYMLGRLLSRAIDRKNIPFITPFYQEFLRISVVDRYRNAVNDIYERALAFSDKQQAPHFQLVNEKGDTVNLSDYYGKLVYISFWAGWCQPCIKELEESKSNKIALEGQDIAFLYISVDNTKSEWLKALSKYPTKGINIWAEGRQTAVTNAYNVVSLPHYFLLDKQGRFITDFKKASDDEFVFLVQRLLKD